NGFFEEGKYSPIKITAHTREALAQAKIFAAAYKKLTGENASIIQNCPDQVLEEKVKEVKDEEVWKEVRQELKSDTQKFSKYFTASMILTNLCPYMLPTSIKNVKAELNKPTKESEKKLTASENFGIQTGLPLGILCFIGQATLYAMHPPFLLIPLGTNLASAGYEWIMSKYNTVKERKKKEAEEKNE
ncbi:hypothetical protein HY837_01055, partial [archaeon]|nr:hypothetical protein [archaeon]